MKQQTKELSLLPHQYELCMDDTTKVLGLVSGWGGGKTYAVARKAMFLMLANPGCDGIACEPNYPLLTQILIPELKDALEFFGIEYNHAKVENIFYCKVHGLETRIICKSLESFDRLIGINAAWAILDEFDTTKANLAYSAYQKILGRLRGGNVRQLVIVSTPEGFGAMHRIFVTEASENKKLIRAKTTDNKYLPQDYIDTIRKSFPANMIDAYLNGEFVNLAGNPVYYSFNRFKCNSTRDIKESEPLHIGMDFNIGKMAAIVAVIDQGIPIVCEEIFGVKDTSQICQVIRSRYGYNRQFYIYPDASGAARKTSAAQTDIDILAMEGFCICSAKSNPRVKDRINTANKLFEDGFILINSINCTNLVECLEQQIYNNAGEPDKTGGRDHLNDALTYFLYYHWSISYNLLADPAVIEEMNYLTHMYGGME